MTIHITGHGSEQPLQPKQPVPASSIAPRDLFQRLIAANQDRTPCRTCGAAPTPSVVTDTEGRQFTVYSRCEHERNAEYARLELQDRKEARDRLQKALGLYQPPLKFQSVRLADIKTSHKGRTLEGISRALAISRQYLDDFDTIGRKGGHGMFLYGVRGKHPGDSLGQGVGKSMLSAAIANELHDRGHYVAWFKIKSLCERLFDYGKDTRRLQVLEAVERADFVVLDELIDEKDTAAKLREFMRLVDLRCENKRPTLVTSNFNLAHIAGQFEGVLERDRRDGYGDRKDEDDDVTPVGVMVVRFMSRFQVPYFKRVAIHGPDFRLFEAQADGADWGIPGEDA